MDPLCLKALEERCLDSAMYAWSHGKDTCEQGPSFAYLNLNNRCNFKCAMCGHKTMMRTHRGPMSFDVFKRVVDQLPESVYRVWLMKQGEALLNKEFCTFAKYLKEQRPEITTQVATNASPLTRKSAECLVRYMDYMDIGIHGIERGTYRNVVGRDLFDRVIGNVRYLDELLERTNSDLVYNITYVRQPVNEHESDEAVEAFFRKTFKNFGRLVIKWESNFQGEIEEANLQLTKKAGAFPKCMLPYCTITYLHDGNVSYCCAEAKENYFVGNIMAQTSSEIWNGEKMVSFRRRLNGQMFDELEECGIGCRDCSWPWSFETQNPEMLVSRQSKELLEDTAKPMPVSIEDFLRLGFVCYLNSELAEALGHFTAASVIRSDNDEWAKSAVRWKEELERVYRTRYGNMETWEDGLNEEGKSFRDMTRTIINKS